MPELSTARSPGAPSRPAGAGARPARRRRVPARGGAVGAQVLVGRDGDRRVVDRVHPASKSSGVSTTAARGGEGRRKRLLAEGGDALATRGQISPSSHARSSGVANARAATAERSTVPPGATSSPQRPTTAATTSGSPLSSCTTASVESVAAPSRPRAASAVDLPEPSPPVRRRRERGRPPRARLGGRLGGGGCRPRGGLRRLGVVGGRILRDRLVRRLGRRVGRLDAAARGPPRRGPRARSRRGGSGASSAGPRARSRPRRPRGLLGGASGSARPRPPRSSAAARLLGGRLRRRRVGLLEARGTSSKLSTGMLSPRGRGARSGAPGPRRA